MKLSNFFSIRPWAAIGVSLNIGMATTTVHAQNQATHPCPELAGEAYQKPKESCNAHLACQLVLSELKACPKAKGFLKALGGQIGEGRSVLFFGSNTDARLSDVWTALASLIPSDGLKEKKWATELETLDDTTYNERDVAKGTDATTGTWTFWGKLADGRPTGMGVHFEVNGKGFRLMRGNFNGRSTSELADVIKYDGSMLSRQVGIYEGDRLKGGTDTITLNENGLMMNGRFDTSLSLFEGVIEQPDKSRLKGTYHIQTGDGQLEVLRPDGTLKERGMFKNNQLYVGEKFDPSGRVIEVVNQKKVEEAKEQQRLLAERNERAKQAQEQLNAQIQQQENARKAEQELRSNLERWHAGQLFAYADEALASQQSEKARLALRALIRRFPEHALAGQAAAMIGKMTSNTASASGSQDSTTALVMRPLSGIKTNTQQCDEQLLQLEKEQQEVVTQNPTLPPYASYRQTIQFATQRLQVLDSKCSPNIRNQMMKEQLLKAISEAEQACRKVVVDESLCARF